jgi:hypothetical protein
MAQTKSRPAGSRASGKATKSTSGKASKNKASKNGGAGNGSAKAAGFDLASAARKAKTPLIASGAALAGAAGGLALGSRGSRGGKIVGALRPSKPRIQMSSHDLAEAAKSVGQFGAQMGELATELRRTREEAANEKRRSPIEVVLEGLTARSSKR